MPTHVPPLPKAHRYFSQRTAEEIYRAVTANSRLSPGWNNVAVIQEATRFYAIPLIAVMHACYLVGGLLIAAGQHMQPVVASSAFSEWAWTAGLLSVVSIGLYSILLFGALPIGKARRLLPVLATTVEIGNVFYASSLFLSPDWSPITFATLLAYVLVSVPSIACFPASRIASSLYAIGVFVPAAYFLWPQSANSILLYVVMFGGVVPLLHYAVYVVVREVHQALLHSNEIRILAGQLADANAELGSLHKQAASELARRTEFFNGAAHDLGQRIHLVKLTVDLIRQRLGPDANSFASLVEAVESISGYANSLLEFARLESGSITPQHTVIPLAFLWKDLKLHFAPVEETRNVHLRFRSSDLCVYSDPSLLRRILDNLISNALKVTRDGVLVVARKRAANIVIEVWDRGLGIPTPFHNQVFVPFRRSAESDRPDLLGGHGLGLATVQRLCALLGHSVSFSTREAHGTVFRITIASVGH